jgi:hypothetical protein
MQKPLIYIHFLRCLGDKINVVTLNQTVYFQALTIVSDLTEIYSLPCYSNFMCGIWNAKINEKSAFFGQIILIFDQFWDDFYVNAESLPQRKFPVFLLSRSCLY